MKVRSRLTKTGLVVALLSTTALVSTGALAQPVGTAPASGQTAATDDSAPWWFHGTVELGGRDFVNNPEKNGQTASKFGFVGGGSKSLSGYYEYNDIQPGAFGNFDISAGSKDGLYRIDAGGRNVGYEDQSFYFDWSKAGEQYFNFYWDQSPHLYSMNAVSPLTRNGNVVSFNPGIPAAATTAGALQPFGQVVDIGIHRDTAAATYRWTPGGDWDVNLDYSHTERTGTQPTQGFSGNLTASTPLQFMKPVDDSTQNYGAKGEYVGSSPWGQRYVFSLGYNGSQYQDSYNDFLVQAAPGSANFATFANWPSNQANALASTLSVDLPWNSRYVGTLNYSMMRQDASFANGGGYLPSGQPTLDGGINTLLSNNVVTTKIAPDLTAKTTFRYYDFKNDTAQIGFLVADSRSGAALDTAAAAPGAAPTAFSISMGYIKTNAGEELDWRPNKYWNIGAGYEYERYDWTRADVNVTNQNGAKVFADYKPWSWLTSRASAEYNDRRYDNYNYCNYVGEFQWDSTTCRASYNYNSTEQQFMIDNRQVWKANYLVDIQVLRNVTLTPWTKYQDASYSIDPNFQQGLSDSKSWNFGIDGLYVVNSDLSLMAGYSRMYATDLMTGSSSDGPPTVTNPYLPVDQNQTNERNVVNTFVAAVRYAAIPNKLDTELRYTASHGTDDLGFVPAAQLGTTGAFPENKVWFQRLEATAVYKFDPEQVAALGWKGDIKLKLNYAWEMNSETNWANDPLSLTQASSQYVGNVTVGAGTGIWMGWYNPNYNVQIVSASLIGSW